MAADASLESPASASLACVCLALSAQISSQEPGHACRRGDKEVTANRNEHTAEKNSEWGCIALWGPGVSQTAEDALSHLPLRVN